MCIQVIASNKTRDTTLLLFLNKTDLFKKKIEAKKDFEAFQKVFPKYNGGQDVDAAIDYVGDQFKSIAKTEGRNVEELNVHKTCALDTEAMDAVFVAVRDNVFKANIMFSM